MDWWMMPRCREQMEKLGESPITLGNAQQISVIEKSRFHYLAVDRAL